MENKNKKFVIVCFTIFAIIMGFRSNDVGIDTRTYEFIFYDINTIGMLETHVEKGWILINRVVGYFCRDYYVFQIVYSMIYNLLSARFIYKSNNNVFVSVLVYLGLGMFSEAMNVQRQFLAIIIIANAYLELKENNRFRQCCLALSAIFIHTTSLLYIIIILIYKIKNKKIFYMIPFLFIPILLMYDKILSILFEYLPFYKGYFLNQSNLITAYGIWLLWSVIVIISLITIYSNIFNKEEGNYAIFSIIYVVCEIIGTKFNYFDRLGWYFIPFIIILLVVFGNKFSNKLKYIYYTGISLMFSVFYIYSIIQNKTLVYSTFFE